MGNDGEDIEHVVRGWRYGEGYGRSEGGRCG